MSKHVETADSSAVATAALHADAWERALRTLWTGFGVDALVAIGAGVLTTLDGGDVTSPVFWTGVGVLILRSTLTAGASYLVRLKVTPSASV